MLRRLIWGTLGALSFLFLILFNISQYSYTPARHLANIFDSWENLLYSFYVANGWIVYQDFMANHMPGIYLFTAPFLKMSGAANLNPSDNMYELAGYSAFFATTLVQNLCVFILLRCLHVKSGLAIFLSSIFTYCLNHRFNLMIPMSEDYILYGFILLPTLVMRSSQYHKDKYPLKYPLALTIIAPLLINLVGLTHAPSTLWIFSLVIMWTLTNHNAPLYKLNTWKESKPIILACSLILLFVGTCLFMYVNLERLWYYNVVFNQPLSQPISAMLTNITNHFDFTRYHKTNALMNIPITIFLTTLASYSLFNNKKLMSYKEVSFFFTTLVGAAILCVWRDDHSYKTIGILGINIGILIMMVVHYLPKIVSIEFKFSNRWLPLILSIVCLTVLNKQFHSGAKQNLWNSIKTSYKQEGDKNLTKILHRQGICSFREENSTCKCLRTFHFDPQLFLKNNVRACKPEGMWVSLYAYDSISDRKFHKQVQDPHYAYLLYSQQDHAIVGVPKSYINLVKKYKECERIDDRISVCTSEEGLLDLSLKKNR